MSYSKEDNNNRGWDIGTEDYDPPRIDMAGLSEKTVYVLYINAIIENSAVLNHDIWRFVSSLQGVINRRLDEHGRCVYVVFKDSVVSNDAFWLEYLSGTGKLLDGYSKVPVYTLENLSDIFKNQLVQTGMILWDTRVPATANVAATTCGLYNYIPVKYDTAENSLYNMFVSRGISVKKNLVGLFTGEGMIPDIGMPSTGSAKNDAYYWAAFMYMSKTDPQYLAYYADGAVCIPGTRLHTPDAETGGHICSLPNHDYYIAKRTFFYDLSPIDEEAPCDDLGQPLGTDAATFRKIIGTQCKRNGYRMISSAGHVPWFLKYSTYHGMGKYSDLEIEERWMRFVGTNNVVVDSDAAHPCWITNASVYGKAPFRNYPNNNKSNENIPYDPKTVYLTLFLGDYDSSAWVKGRFMKFWKGKERDARPMTWDLNPNLADRIAPIYEYISETMTEHDYFTTSNSGAGAISPEGLFVSLNKTRDIPDGGEAWREWSKRYYSRFNMDITGITYNMAGLAPELLELYASFSPACVYHTEAGPENIAVRYKDTLFLYCDPHAGNLMSASMEVRAERIIKSLAENIRFGYHFGAFRVGDDVYEDMIALQDMVSEMAKKRFPEYNFVWSDPYTLVDAIKRNGVFSRTFE